LVIFLAGSMLTLTVVGGVALAQNETIDACVKSNGEVRIVETGEVCKDNETPLSWNVTGPVGPQGPEGPPGPPGPGGGLSGYQVVLASADIGPDRAAFLEAACPEGKVVTGGGFDVSDEMTAGVSAPTPPLNDGWTVLAVNPTGIEAIAFAYAICVAAPSGD
jgi:hypothetical protein